MEMEGVLQPDDYNKALNKIRSEVDTRSSPYLKVVVSYTWIINSLLDMLTLAIEPVRRTAVGTPVATLLLVQRIKVRQAVPCICSRSSVCMERSKEAQMRPRSSDYRPSIPLFLSLSADISRRHAAEILCLSFRSAQLCSGALSPEFWRAVSLSCNGMSTGAW